MLTEFQNSCTDRFTGKLVVKKIKKNQRTLGKITGKIVDHIMRPVCLAVYWLKIKKNWPTNVKLTSIFCDFLTDQVLHCSLLHSVTEHGSF